MALVARALLESARDFHPAFDPRQHPDRVLLRQLSAYQRMLAGKALELNRTALVATDVIDMATYDFAVGHPFPSVHALHGGTVTFGDGATVVLAITAWQNRMERMPRYGCFRQGGVLFLRGVPEEWSGVTSVSLSYAPIPAELTAPADTLALPDYAEPACIAFLAYAMALRSPAEMKVPLGAFAEGMQAAEASFLADVRKQFVAIRFRIEDRF